MSANATVCGNCRTENPPGTDECTKCGQPLTGSADTAVRTQLEAQGDDTLDARQGEAQAVSNDFTGQGLPIPPRGV